MDSIPNTDNLKLNAAQEIYQDGLTEIVAGALLFIVALATGRPAFYWTYFVAIVLLGPGLERIRARVTYPRIGYAKLESEDPKRLSAGILRWVLGVFLITAIALAATGHLSDNISWRRAAPAIGGLLFAGGFAYLAQQSRFKRHWALAISSGVIGGAMVFPSISEPYGNLRVWALVMGLICLAVGALALRSFVRHYHVVEERLPDE